jgi:hypothetical protein
MYDPLKSLAGVRFLTGISRRAGTNAMAFYQDQIVPLLIDWSMQQRNLAAYRGRIIPATEGPCSKSALVPVST